jgi:hypothetical protein
MKIKIIAPRYVTATVQKHLKAFLESKRDTAKINTKHYSILESTPIEGGKELKIVVMTPYIRESTRQKEFSKQTITCQYLTK